MTEEEKAIKQFSVLSNEDLHKSMSLIQYEIERRERIEIAKMDKPQFVYVVLNHRTHWLEGVYYDEEKANKGWKENNTYVSKKEVFQ